MGGDLGIENIFRLLVGSSAKLFTGSRLARERRFSSFEVFADIYLVEIESNHQRRSKIEGHPDFSDAPDSRSSIPHPKTDSSKNQIAWPESRKLFLSKSRLAFQRFGLKEARLSETKIIIIAEMCYTSIVERVINMLYFVYDFGLARHAVLCRGHPS